MSPELLNTAWWEHMLAAVALTALLYVAFSDEPPGAG